MTFKIIILQGEGMKIDLTQAMKNCEGIQKIEQRSDTGKVRIIYKLIFLYLQRQKFDSATYEKNKQEKEKKQIINNLEKQLFYWL